MKQHELDAEYFLSTSTDLLKEILCKNSLSTIIKINSIESAISGLEYGLEKLKEEYGC